MASYVCMMMGLGVISAAAQTRSLSLGGSGWELQNANGSIGLKAVSVPGNVHSELIRARLIPNVYQGYADTQTQWVASDNWTYSTRFDIVAAEGLVHELVCEGLDTVATVTVNDVTIGHAANQFRKHVWRLPAHVLRPNANVLRVMFQGPVPYAAREAGEYPYQVIHVA